MANKFVECKVSGLEEIQRKLEEMAGPKAKAAMRAGLKAGATISLKAIQAAAPKDTGFLEEHFDMKISVKGAGDTGVAMVGPQGKMDYPLAGGGYKEITDRAGKKHKFGSIAVASVARFHEFGTKFMPAKPFMSSAFQATWQKSVDAIAAALKKGLGL